METELLLLLAQHQTLLTVKPIYNYANNANPNGHNVNVQQVHQSKLMLIKLDNALLMHAQMVNLALIHNALHAQIVIQNVVNAPH